MVSQHIFAYNTGSTISGTDQVGSIAISNLTQDYSQNIGGVRWWGGPDEAIGYVIAVPITDGLQHTPIPGVNASLAFYRTSAFTDPDFIILSEDVSRQFGMPQTFTGATQASDWLTANGFWNTYGGAPSFTLTSSDLMSGNWFNAANGHLYSEPLGTNGVDGFTYTYYPGDPNYLTKPGNVPWAAQLGSSAIESFFLDLVANGFLTNIYEDALWSVSWGAGSSISSGYVSMSGSYVGNNMFISALDTSVPGWDSGNNFISNTALQGTFLLPATFTLVLPTVNKGGWC